MRMCGHAHHDDMLYLGRDPHPSWEYPAIDEHGYVDHELYAYWSGRDPIATYAARLEADGPDRRRRSRAMARRGRRPGRARSPRHHRRCRGRSPSRPGVGVFAGRGRRGRASKRSIRGRARGLVDGDRRCRRSSPVRRSIRKGARCSMPSRSGSATRCAPIPRVFVYGEDVGGQYGNAFLLLRPLLEELRRSHHQLAAGRRRGARRLRRRGAGRAAADRRDPVQRLRRHRLQSAGEQRREDRATGGAAACRWSCACRLAASATPAPTIPRTPRPGSIARRA